MSITRSCLTLVLVLAILVPRVAESQKIDVEIRAADGVQLRGSYHSPGRPGPGVMLFHMCDSDRVSLNAMAAQLAARGMHVMAWDFRGYGHSGGERGANPPADDVSEVWRKPGRADVRAVHNWFVAQPGVDESRLAAGGGGCGASLALLYAELNAPYVKGAVLLAGATEVPRHEFVGRADWLAVLGASSRNEVTPSQWIRDVVAASRNPASRALTLDNAGRGTDMLSRDAGLARTIASWVATRLAAPSAVTRAGPR